MKERKKKGEHVSKKTIVMQMMKRYFLYRMTSPHDIEMNIRFKYLKTTNWKEI